MHLSAFLNDLGVVRLRRDITVLIVEKLNHLAIFSERRRIHIRTQECALLLVSDRTPHHKSLIVLVAIEVKIQLNLAIDSFGRAGLERIIALSTSAVSSSRMADRSVPIAGLSASLARESFQRMVSASQPYNALTWTWRLRVPFAQRQLKA